MRQTKMTSLLHIRAALCKARLTGRPANAKDNLESQHLRPGLS